MSRERERERVERMVRHGIWRMEAEVEILAVRQRWTNQTEDDVMQVLLVTHSPLKSRYSLPRWR